MPHGYQIRLLNPSSPQYGYRTAFIEQIRGLLDYSHPRFYAALVAIQAEPLAQERKDMQMILQAEVVSARQLLAEELIGYFTSLDVSHEVSWCCKRCRSAL